MRNGRRLSRGGTWIGPGLIAVGQRYGWVLLCGAALILGAVGLARLLPQVVPPLAAGLLVFAWLHHRRRWRERLLSHTAGLLLTPRRL